MYTSHSSNDAALEGFSEMMCYVVLKSTKEAALARLL